MAEGLEDYRAELDRLDDQLVDLLARRDQVVAQIGALKRQSGWMLRDRKREARLLARLLERAAQQGLPAHYVKDLVSRIIEHSLLVQSHHFRVALGDTFAPRVLLYQGAPGAYSYIAASRIAAGFALPPKVQASASFGAMLQAVEAGDADAALLPIENSTAGSINEAYDLLLESKLFVIGEVLQPVSHCLLTLDESVDLSQVRRILSHPQALAQCAKYLEASLPYAAAESFVDTALAAEKVRALGDPSVAAIASASAADLHGLAIRETDIADTRNNTTRMVLVAREPMPPPEGAAPKTSIVFALKHKPAALLGALEVFSEANLSLTKLESRPRRHRPWEYVFYADFEGSLGTDPEASSVLKAIAEMSVFVRWLGTYPAQPSLQQEPRMFRARLRDVAADVDSGVKGEEMRPTAPLSDPALAFWHVLGVDRASARPLLLLALPAYTSGTALRAAIEASERFDVAGWVLAAPAGAATVSPKAIAAEARARAYSLVLELGEDEGRQAAPAVSALYLAPGAPPSPAVQRRLAGFALPVLAEASQLALVSTAITGGERLPVLVPPSAADPAALAAAPSVALVDLRAARDFDAPALAAWARAGAPALLLSLPQLQACPSH